MFVFVRRLAPPAVPIRSYPSAFLVLPLRASFRPWRETSDRLSEGLYRSTPTSQSLCTCSEPPSPSFPHCSPKSAHVFYLYLYILDLKYIKCIGPSFFIFGSGCTTKVRHLDDTTKTVSSQLSLLQCKSSSKLQLTSHKNYTNTFRRACTDIPTAATVCISAPAHRLLMSPASINGDESSSVFFSGLLLDRLQVLWHGRPMTLQSVGVSIH